MPNDEGNPNDEIRKAAEVIDAVFNLSFVIHSSFVIRASSLALLSVLYLCLSVAYGNFLVGARSENEFPIAHFDCADVVLIPVISEIFAQSPGAILPI